MDYKWKTEEQAEGISGKFSLPGAGQGVKFPKINPFGGKGKKSEENPEEPEKMPEEKPEVPAEPVILPEALPKRITITMLGISGSGKTMFLSGVYQSLIQASCCGVSLVGDESRQDFDSPLKVTGQIAKIALVNNGSPEKGWSFPLGTNQTVEYPLKLMYQEEEVCGFDFLDYAGGQLDILTDSVESNLNGDQKKLLDQLEKSDELMIFADADVIARHNVFASKSELALCRREIGVFTVNQLFNQLKKSYRNRSMTVLLILTKIDKVPRELRLNHCAELVRRVKKVYEELWEDLSEKSHAEENPWNIGIVPVTAIGIDNEVRGDVVTQFPDPENMDAAMVYSVAVILKQRSKRLTQEAAALLEMKKTADPPVKKAIDERIAQMLALQKKLENYVITLTLNTGIVPKILERSDVLGWWV